MNEKETIRYIPIGDLVPYEGQPFALYNDERMDGLVASVKERGILYPLIVRPVADEGKFEILSGHNRLEAAKIAGLDAVPAIVRESLTDDEALFIVTESNLIQRSFADMTHGERAKALSVHYNAIKQKAGRKAFVDEIEKLVANYSPLGNNLSATSMSKIGSQYGLSKNTIARYLRVAKLNSVLLDWLDEEKAALPFRAGVALSYLRENEQDVIAKSKASKPKLSVDIEKAEALRNASADHELTEGEIEYLLQEKEPAPPKRRLAFERSALAKYFTDEQTDDEITAVIEEALAAYYESKENGNGDDNE